MQSRKLPMRVDIKKAISIIIHKKCGDYKCIENK